MGATSIRLRSLDVGRDPGGLSVDQIPQCKAEPSGAVKTSCHSSGRSSRSCRFRHIRRTTSSPSFPLELEWNGRMDTAGSGPGALSRKPVEDSVVVLRALTGLDSRAVVHKSRKSRPAGSPPLHNACSTQSKVDSRHPPQCIPVDLVNNAVKVPWQKAGRSTQSPRTMPGTATHPDQRQPS